MRSSDGVHIAILHVQRVDAGEVREAGFGEPLRRPCAQLPAVHVHVQRVDAGEVREAGVGDPRAPRDVQRGVC